MFILDIHLFMGYKFFDVHPLTVLFHPFTYFLTNVRLTEYVTPYSNTAFGFRIVFYVYKRNLIIVTICIDKFQDVDIVSGLIDKTKLTLDESQMSVKMGLDEQLKELQTSKPFLFFDSKAQEDKKVGTTGGANPPAGGKAPSATDMSWGAVLAEKLNFNQNQN